MDKSLGVPLTLMHEAEGTTVSVELRNGETYRGVLNSSEDTMNCHMSDVTMRAKDGRVFKLERVYIRGSQKVQPAKRKAKASKRAPKQNGGRDRMVASK